MRTNDRYRLAYTMRQEGKTFKAIGAALGGVSVERARQMVALYKREIERRAGKSIWADAELAGVSLRAINDLRREGLESKEDIRNAMLSGEKIYGIGATGLSQICEWLEIPSQATSQPSQLAIDRAVRTLTKAGITVEL